MTGTEGTEVAGNGTTVVDTGNGTDTGAGAGEGSTTDAGGGSAPSAPPVLDWNGEVDHLVKADWYAKLDKAVQDVLLKGVEAKYKAYDRKYRATWDEQARRGRDFDAREAALAEQERRIMRMWTGEEDPMAAKQSEIDAMKQAHATMVERMVQEHRAELERAQGPSPELEAKVQQVEDLGKKLKDIEAERDGFRGRIEAVEKAEQEAALESFEKWLSEEAPHLVGDDADSEGFDALVTLLEGGMPPARAIKMVLAEFPAPVAEEKPVAKAPGPAIRAMGRGDTGGTEKRETRDLQDVFDQMRRQAQQTWSRG